MNVFEDLIEELRDENLLENTIIDLQVDSKTASARRSDSGAAAKRALAEDSAEVTEQDFYRKRAIEEISSLQMVEHVLSGIEREHLKSVPASYDDLQAKKALHMFLQVEGDTATSEYADAEFNLMRETEAWSSVLSERDLKISVANLRRFCENSRPPLSSQALLSLARFYRNAPFCELTRAKFEFVMTRLFSRENEGDKRRLLFGRADMVGHIKTLYANWASVALYSADDASLKARTLVGGFDEKAAEADGAETFDRLVKNDFFKKVHHFKEATGEMFFTPEVVAATIDCNTRIGNKFVDLIRLERDRTNLESLEQKYGYAHDEEISDAAGKTLELVEVLKNLPDDDEHGKDQTPGIQPTTRVVSTTRKPDQKKRFEFKLFAVNKWLLLATIVIASVSGTLYFWADQATTESSVAESAGDVSLENTELKDYVRSARSTPGTLYAITQPSWDELNEEKKRELLQQGLELASRNGGQKNVQFVNIRGRVEAYAVGDKLEVLNP